MVYVINWWTFLTISFQYFIWKTTTTKNPKINQKKNIPRTSMGIDQPSWSIRKNPEIKSIPLTEHSQYLGGNIIQWNAGRNWQVSLNMIQSLCWKIWYPIKRKLRKCKYNQCYYTSYKILRKIFHKEVILILPLSQNKHIWLSIEKGLNK